MFHTKNILNRMMSLSLLASVGFVALLSLAQTDAALAQVAPPLGVVQQFGALGGSGVTGAAGTGVIVDGDVGSSPTATISNFPPSSVTSGFVLHLTNDGVVQQARLDATAAALNLASQGPGTLLAAQLNGQVLTSGIYSFASTADLAASGTLTLNGPGVFVFIVNSALTANVLSNVVGDADPCNVFWWVGTSATLNGNSFYGTVIASTGFVTVGASANVTGRVVAATAVTMAGAGGNTIGGCSAPVLAPTTLITQVSSPAVALGAAISDTATLSGGTNPTGQITFNLYGPNDATCSSAAIFTSTVTVAGNGSYGSTPAFTPTAVGTYRWIANYSGDANNNATTNACNGANENVVVTVTVGPTVTAVPTLSEWGVIIFMLLVGLMSIYYLRRQKAKA